MMITSEQEGTMQTQTFHFAHLLCLSFWYFSFGLKNDYEVDVELYVLSKEVPFRFRHFKADNIWHLFQAQIYIGNGDYIRFRFSSTSKTNVLFGIDDFSLSASTNCEGKLFKYIFNMFFIDILGFLCIHLYYKKEDVV